MKRFYHSILNPCIFSSHQVYFQESLLALASERKALDIAIVSTIAPVLAMKSVIKDVCDF